MQYDPQEIEQLDKTIKILREALLKVTHSITGYDHEYNDLKKYMVDYKNEMDKMEIFNYQQTLFTIDRTGVAKLNEQSKIAKLIESPYFGRFDFIYEGDRPEDAELFYIGRFGFTDKDGNNLIYDWRAPVCNMYYEFELGEAHYNTRQGVMYGNLIKKRQFKIAESQFEYIIDSSLTIQDGILQKTLSEQSNEKMKTIITSIQKEQNQIIRNESAHTVIIQGVAGSGKTSVALHRIAYLLYKFHETLRADKIMILSPNNVFGDYISSVLPELGEQPIRDYTINQLTEQLLPKKVTFTPFPDEITMVLEKPDSSLAARVEWKSNVGFLRQLDNFLQQLNTYILPNKRMTIAEYDIEGDYLQERFWTYSNEPVFKRIELLAEDILAILKTKRQGEWKMPSKKEIIKRLANRLIYKTPLEIYKAFFVHVDREDAFVFKKAHFEFADIYPYLYCQIYFKNIEKFDQISHFVLDEMQDYTPVQYAVLQRIFPCRKTIIGDFGQSLLPFKTGLKKAFDQLFTNHEYVELNKSYRSSFEIIDYARKFTASNSMEAIERHGESPLELEYSSKTDLLAKIKTELTEFRASPSKTCAIICKTETQRDFLASQLSDFESHLVDRQTKEFSEGITLATIQYAKGLEFDQVLVPFVDAETYNADFDKGLLYIACTRAMHKLTLFIPETNPSPLL